MRGEASNCRCPAAAATAVAVHRGPASRNGDRARICSRCSLDLACYICTLRESYRLSCIVHSRPGARGMV